MKRSNSTPALSVDLHRINEDEPALAPIPIVRRKPSKSAPGGGENHLRQFCV
jgi:hypothetical protein